MFNWLFGLRCPDCGERISEHDQHCPYCGTDLDASNEQLSKVTAAQYLEKAQKDYDRGAHLKAALSNCSLAVQYDPSLAAAHNLRGLILDALGRTDEAIYSYEEALRLNPSFEEARENLEDARLEMQNEAPVKKSTAPSKDTWLKVIISAASLVVIAVGLGSLYLLYNLGLQYLGPKTTIIFEPDYAQVPVVDPVDLELTAQLLTERSRFLGYAQVSFSVQDDQIIGKVPGSVDAEALVKRVKAIGLLEFVDFGKTRVPEGTLITTDLEHKYLTQTGNKKWHTVMTNAEIASVSVGVDATGEPAIDFVLTPAGSEIFNQYTTKNIGSYLGIVLDKVVISTPYVQGPIPDGQGQISGNFTKETAEELAMFLRITPLPIPLKLQQEANSDK